MQQPTSTHAAGETESSSPYVNMEQGEPVSVEKFEDEFQNNDGGDGDDDNQSIAVSIVDSVMTADGIHDTSGFHIVCLVILLGDMSRGVFFPSLWNLVDSLGGTEVTQGFAVAAFSFGRILVSPLFGRWSITHGYSKTLTLSCSILLLGTLLYAQIQNVGYPAFLIFAQIVLGIGSGTLGVTRAFVADVTAQRNRTTYMAWITAVQYGGFTVTPFIGAIFNKLLGDMDWKFGILRLNMFTAPAYFMSTMISVALILMHLFFKDRIRVVAPKEMKKSKKREAIDDHASQMTWVGLTVYDCCILGCMLLNVSTKGNIAAFETLGISLAESHFGMESARAGAIVATSGTIGVFSLLSMGYLAKYVDDIQLICGGMVVMISGIVSLTFLQDDVANPQWQYALAIFLLYSVGYPIGHTAVIGLFSKIVGRRPQGELQGWFASAGSLARILFPITTGLVTKFADVTTLFYILSIILAVSTAITLYNKDTLVFLSR